MLVEEKFWRDLGLEQEAQESVGKGNGSRSGRRQRTVVDQGDISFTERHYRHVDLIGTYFERDAARAATTYTADMITAVKNARRAREQHRQHVAAAQTGGDVGLR